MSDLEQLVCVECGTEIDKLLLEYSPGNIKLMRCAKCGQVADKYLEFEIVLVLIDVVLHRPSAFRHLIHNRTLFSSKTAIYQLMAAVLLANMLLKEIVLHSSHFASTSFPLLSGSATSSSSSAIAKSSSSNTPQHISALPLFEEFWWLGCTCVLEHIVFVVALGGCWLDVLLLMDAGEGEVKSDGGRSSFWKMPRRKLVIFRKFLVAILFPELLRASAVVLQIFDYDASLLVLVSAMIFSVQLTALRLVGLQTKPNQATPAWRFGFSLVVAWSLRWLIRRWLHSSDGEDWNRLGIFL